MRVRQPDSNLQPDDKYEKSQAMQTCVEQLIKQIRLNHIEVRMADRIPADDRQQSQIA